MSTSKTVVEAGLSPFAARYGNFIGGKWVAPAAGRYFDNITPINGRKICEIPRSDEADVNAALDAAHAAREAWGRTSTAHRAIVLNKIADRMEQNLERLATAFARLPDAWQTVLWHRLVERAPAATGIRSDR